MDYLNINEMLHVEPQSLYDVAMEPLIDSKVNKIGDGIISSSQLNSLTTIDLKNNIMSLSLTSALDDTTPSDSGVQLLDSESSELMIESITSQNGLEFDDKESSLPASSLMITASSNNLPDLVLRGKDVSFNSPAMTESDLENSNLIQDQANVTKDNIMQTSNCSTFDTENIVYRRKVKKQHNIAKAVPKKRVSFHEDILKSTKTDNIHIEHGFITYKKGKKGSNMPGRYSWCLKGDDETLYQENSNNENQRTVYRNACSDVLDYGNADIYENLDNNHLKYDNSGIFEYHPQLHVRNNDLTDNTDKKQVLYKCSCSSSNSSLDSGSDDSNSNNYSQAKSNSCDCIRINNVNNNFIGDNCYFSEPSFENINETNRKSVWSKEGKPKTSCLKKTERHTDIIQEHDLRTKIKKFNVHDMNNIIDNSKIIFGSLKSMFTISLPERGYCEGSEDTQSVYECIPENEVENQKVLSPSSPISKKIVYLSKSLDGMSKNKQNNKNFVHNVDEQLRRKNETDLYESNVPNSDNEESQEKNNVDDIEKPLTEPNITDKTTEIVSDMNHFRNKFIINCESTVFEHTGVSYCYGDDNSNEVNEQAQQVSVSPLVEAAQTKNIFTSTPVKKTFSKILKTLKSPPNPVKFSSNSLISKDTKENDDKIKNESNTCNSNKKQLQKNKLSSNSSDKSSVSLSHSINDKNFDTSSAHKLKNHNRHLQSPMKRRFSEVTRYEYNNTNVNRMSPDIFNINAGLESKTTTLSEEFDDILTIETDTDKNESDIVILDYPDKDSLNKTKCNYESTSDIPFMMNTNLLKPPKTNLINRFLKNVTQKKIMEQSIQRNMFFSQKVKNESKLFTNNLYLKGVKPMNQDLIEDLNAEIAMEIEMSGVNSPRRELANTITENGAIGSDFTQFKIGVGEISVEIFNGNCSHILRDQNEILMKAFKLYTGYSLEGHMTPVLVFLTDRTIYVTDLVGNRLCNKFVLPYSELDVILMGPYGNTVLLCNASRDKQQVLLAGGPYPANGIVANLELCARRSGSVLPAVGQLTLKHLEPLKMFIRQNSSVSNSDSLIYYSVVNTPATTLADEKEPLGPHIKGFLMHRRIYENCANTNKENNWRAGYFLLKAGVLYLFNDSGQKLPTWAMALAECQGARRAVNTGRPYCFEILLNREILQLAAPDEYIASEWLQCLVQSASGLFEMQEKHKTLGCTLVMTENHLITLREDFKEPLRRIVNYENKRTCTPDSPLKENINPNHIETNSAMSSAMSTPTKSNRSNSLTPTRFPAWQSSKLMTNSFMTGTTTRNASIASVDKSMESLNTRMSSVYGENAISEILSCAVIKDMTTIRIPSHEESWWCILEFSCQEVRENSDDLILFFNSSSEMQRFLRTLEHLWQSKNNDLFPVTLLDEDDLISEKCTKLYMEINNAWEPLISAALGYPQ